MRLRGLALAGGWTLCAALAGSSVHADPETAAPAAPVVIDLGGESLRLTLPGVPSLERHAESDKTRKAWWTAAGPGSRIDIEVTAFDNKEGQLADPKAVNAYIGDGLRSPEYRGDPEFVFSETEVVKGKLGPPSYAMLSIGLLPNAKKAEGETFVLGGVLVTHSYVVEVTTMPVQTGEVREKILAFLRRGVTATFPFVDPKWTAEEAKQRWEKASDDPKVVEALRPIVRTKHYLILTDSSAGPLFAKKMELCYEQIQKTYPFEEVEGLRLLPVFLFKDSSEYVAFGVKVSGYSEQTAKATKGHAYRDYYATYYDAPGDPVHIHEATHQLFRNRLHLHGGGSWFQEGVAEYMCTGAGERKGFARNAARSGTFAPFRSFFAAKTILAGCAPLTGGQAYAEAASIVEFLRDGKFHPEKFQTYIHEIGGLPYDGGSLVEAKLQEIYGVDLDGLEKAWLKYWSSK